MSNLCAFLLEDALRHNGNGNGNGNGLLPLGSLQTNGVHAPGLNGMHSQQDNRSRQRSPF